MKKENLYDDARTLARQYGAQFFENADSKAWEALAQGATIWSIVWSTSTRCQLVRYSAPNVFFSVGFVCGSAVTTKKLSERMQVAALAIEAHKRSYHE